MAEAAFLLRMANHILQFEGDINASLMALQRADDVLLAIQAGEKKTNTICCRCGLYWLKKCLRSKNVQRVDVQGIYLRLGALAQSVPNVRSGLTLASTGEADNCSASSDNLNDPCC